MVDTSHQPALGYMEVVSQCDPATLLPIIQAHVANGTIIHSDQWVAYRQVASLPSVSTHATVNHSVNICGSSKRHSHSNWGKAKMKLKNMKGYHASQLPSYLDEFMWHEHFGQTKADAFNNIMLHISEQYTF